MEKDDTALHESTKYFCAYCSKELNLGEECFCLGSCVGQAKMLAQDQPDNWAHRSTGMKCITCMWFVEKYTNVGRCRRHAPTMNGYPVVFTDDWCGDHKLDETKQERNKK